MSAPHVLTVRELLDYLLSLGIARGEIEVRDTTYACVSKSHMLGAHYDSVTRLLFDLGLIEWEDDWDCEDFTMTYVWWSIIAHRKAQRAAGQFYANSPAVFECWVLGISHAIALAIEWDAERGELRHFFIEPQPQASRRELEVSASDLLTVGLLK
ncbi:MAG: hypothetical protein CML13_15845 [Puniceicoccaceae bacterium]|nr:hypothetical protein [Puniceicoccaceae bacterium]